MKYTFFQPPLYVHCICKISVIHRRQPGKFCGPGIRCKGLGDLTINDVKNPPSENGKWVDGLNTFINGSQGLVHIDKFKEIFPNEQSNTDIDDSKNDDNTDIDDSKNDDNTDNTSGEFILIGFYY